METKKNNSSSNKQEIFSVLLEYIEKEGIKPNIYLHSSEKTIKRIYSQKEKPSFF
jgi:hypothetical protein